LQDDAIGSVAFEVEIDNRTNDDFAYDPQSLEIKDREQTYDAVMEEAAGTVKPGSSEKVYFVVNESCAPERDGLIAGEDLRLSLKDSPKNATHAFDSPTGSYLPTAMTVQSPTELPDATLAQNRPSNSDPPAAATPAKHAVAKKAGRKSDSKPEPGNAKDSLAKSQKPERKKLFGWL
jgi:hypothetical protein